MKKIWSLLLAVGISLCAYGEFKLENVKGKSYCIAVGKEASPAEKKAAKILQTYLRKMLPEARFKVVHSVPDRCKESVIYTGNTGKLHSLKVDLKTFHREELLIREEGKDLFLAGGNPRGTLYAVFEFLEKSGVVFAAVDTKIIPRKKSLVWGKGTLRRKPSFQYRTIVTYIPAGEFKLFHKYNSYRVNSPENGYYEAYGSYGDVHTLVRYSRKFSKKIPSCFAMDEKGNRMVPVKDGDPAALCLSNPATIEKIWTLTLEGYRKSKTVFAQRKAPQPEMYEFSLADDLTVCHCRECKRITKEEGCYTGVVLRLLNEMARRFQKIDPAIKVSTIVYQNTLFLPRKTRPEKNVVPRICVHDNEWLINVLAESVNPLSHKNNAKFLKVYRDWQKCSSTLGIWEYWQYYTKGTLPCVALDAYFENVKFYQQNKVSNLLIEMENYQASFFALKMYLALKLMDDPARNREELISTFMTAYYGKAAPVMKEYLLLLDSAVKQESGLKPMGPRHPKSYSYLNEEFFRKSYTLLARAEKLAAKNTLHLAHVRYEYTALDYGLLQVWDKVGSRLGLPRKTVLARLKRHVESQIRSYLKNTPRGKKDLTKLHDFILGESLTLPVPPEVKGQYIFDYKAHQMYADNKYTRKVKDPDSVTGMAVEILDQPNCTYKGKKVPYHRVPVTFGIYNSLTKSRMWGPHRKLEEKEIPQDEKYHLYKIGRWFLVDGSRIWGHWTWHFQFRPRTAYTATPDYMNDVYISLKFTGPAYVKGSGKPNAIFVDRIIVAR